MMVPFKIVKGNLPKWQFIHTDWLIPVSTHFSCHIDSTFKGNKRSKNMLFRSLAPIRYFLYSTKTTKFRPLICPSARHWIVWKSYLQLRNCFKETVLRDRFQKLWQKLTDIGLNKGHDRVSNFSETPLIFKRHVTSSSGLMLTARR
jgi:hypothetical protein